MKRVLLALVAAVALAAPANAAVITFDGIPPVGLTTGLFTEAGYDLALTGMFVGVEGLGSEMESLAGFPETGNLNVKRTGGGVFTFDSLGIQWEYGTPPGVVRVEGFLLGISQGLDLLVSGSPAYTTAFASVLSGDLVDELVITGQRDGVAGMSFDNLAVTAPEPASMLLFALGAAGLAVRRSRQQ